MREIYEGGIAVSASDYTHYDDDGDEVEIADLDERVTSHPVLRFTLDYPFDRPYEGTVVTDAGASLRQIIDAIRDAYRTIYRGSVAADIPNLDNKRVHGDYGQAFHVIGDLVIEAIAVDDATGELQVDIGS